MADLPPLSRLPESGISPELVGQLEHSANWARTFGGSGTNIAQRFRHNQDIEQYAGVLQQQREAAQAQMLQESKAAQSLVFGMQKLDMEARQSEARLRHEEELHPLKIKAQEAKIQADLARERAAVQAADFKNTATLQEEADTDAFHKALNDGLSQKIKIGTPQWAELVAGARLAAPAMKSEIFDDVWKATSRSALTPQEALDNEVKRKQALMAVTPPKSPNISPSDSGFLGRYSESVNGIKELLPAIQKVSKGIRSEWADLDAAAKAGTISDDEARKANHWLAKFREASGKSASDAEFEAHFNEVSAKAGALQQKAAPATPPAASPAAPADKLALAKRALDDPNATEAHKLAARKILGL